MTPTWAVPGLFDITYLTQNLSDINIQFEFCFSFSSLQLSKQNLRVYINSCWRSPEATGNHSMPNVLKHLLRACVFHVFPFSLESLDKILFILARHRTLEFLLFSFIFVCFSVEFLARSCKIVHVVGAGHQVFSLGINFGSSVTISTSAIFKFYFDF